MSADIVAGKKALLNGSRFRRDRRTFSIPIPNYVARDSAQGSAGLAAGDELRGIIKKHRRGDQEKREGQTQSEDPSVTQPVGHAGRVAHEQVAGAAGPGAQKLAAIWAVSGSCLHTQAAGVMERSALLT